MSTAVRTIDDVELPAAGTWIVDPGHADVSFVGRHFGLTKVRGRFTRVEGTLEMTDDPADARLDVTIDMTSVESGDQARDDHLRSEDFFDVEHHPTARFTATSIDRTGARGVVHGDLTIRDVTHPVALEVEYLGHAHDPWGNERASFTAAATINRHDWDLTWNMVLEAGGLIVSKEIRLEIDVELIRQ